MATITSNATGAWGTGGTWVGGVVPADNDVVVIATGHVVTFDVDQSAFVTGIDGITVTGTLKLTRTAGTYQLKIKTLKTIAGAGTFDCGTLADPIPFATKHTITGPAQWYINGASGLTCTVYCAEPTIKYIKISANEAIGQTVLSVDTNVAGDIWADGNEIYISASTYGYVGAEHKVIAAGGIAADTITITTPIATAHNAGAYLVLKTRNVRFLGIYAYYNIGMFAGFLEGKLTIGGGQYTTSHGRTVTTSTGVTMSGGICDGLDYPSFAGNNGTVIAGGVFISEWTYVIADYGYFVSGGLFMGGNNGLSGVGTVTGGTFAKLTRGAENFGGAIYNATFENNQADISKSNVVLFNTKLASAIENLSYDLLSRPTYSESINHDQIADNFAAWTKGGITLSQATVKPTGYTLANQTALANANSEGFWQKEVGVEAGASVSMDIWLRKDAAMTYLPNCIIFNKAATDPFAGGAGVHTFTMTNSTDTWEQETYVYTNNTASSVTLVIRFQGKNATGNFFSAITLDVLNVDLTTLITSTNALTTAVSGMWNTAENTLTTTGTIGNKLARMTIVGE